MSHIFRRTRFRCRTSPFQSEHPVRVSWPLLLYWTWTLYCKRNYNNYYCLTWTCFVLRVLNNWTSRFAVPAHRLLSISLRSCELLFFRRPIMPLFFEQRATSGQGHFGPLLLRCWALGIVRIWVYRDVTRRSGCAGRSTFTYHYLLTKKITCACTWPVLLHLFWYSLSISFHGRNWSMECRQTYHVNCWIWFLGLLAPTLFTIITFASRPEPLRLSLSTIYFHMPFTFDFSTTILLHDLFTVNYLHFSRHHSPFFSSFNHQPRSTSTSRRRFVGFISLSIRDRHHRRWTSKHPSVAMLTFCHTHILMLLLLLSRVSRL